MGKTYPIWLLALVPAGRFGRLWSTVGLLCVGALVFGIAAWLQSRNAAACSRTVPCLSWPIALFFVCAVAYIVPAFHYVTSRTHRALDALAPFLDDPALVDDARRAIDRRPLVWYLRTTLVSIGLWLVQSRLLAGSWQYMGERLGQGYVAIAMDWGSLPVWLTMVAAVSALVHNALVVRRLLPRLATDIFEPGSYMPIGSMAVSSTLVVLGAMALLSLMWLGGPTSWWTTLPGLVIFTPIVALLLLLPVWPLHRELLRQRAAAVELAQAQVRAHRGGTAVGDGGLAAALSLRREIARLPVWPFDVGAVTRFVSYAVIVPMTWAGAALIEMLVNLLLE